MKLTRLCAVVVSLAFIGAKEPPESARTGRIFTVEQWVDHVAVVWAVTESRIVVYRTSDFVTDQCRMLAEVPLAAGALDRLRKAVAGLPADAAGSAFMAPNAGHAPMLRIDFSSDGSLSDRRIELWGVSLPWQRVFCEQFADFVPEAWRPSFDAEVAGWQAQRTDAERSVTRKTLDEIYNEPEADLQPVAHPVAVEIVEPMSEAEAKKPQPGATDNPGNAQ
jgi:hypothetical protein